MKANYITLLFCVLCLMSCHSQEKSNNMSELEKQDISISLKFYPTGGIDDIRYSLLVINDSLIVQNHSPRNINDQMEFVLRLSNDQTKEIATLVSAIKTACQNRDISVLDTWGVTLVINNQVVYEVDDFSFKLPPVEIKNLINYLVSLSAIKIDLYGFS